MSKFENNSKILIVVIMKKIIIIFITLFFISGCSLFKRDEMENINVITTNYTLEYVVNYLYGDNSLVSSIYPDGVDIDNYTFTKKQIKDYSKKDLFVYMGVTNDSDQAVTFLNHNNKIKIIDATYGMNYKYTADELWLNPSNLLMITQNIKNGLGEYITSTYLLKNNDTYYPLMAIGLTLPFICVSSILKGYFFGKEQMFPHVFSCIIEDVVWLFTLMIGIPYFLIKGIEYAVAFIILSNIISELTSFIVLFCFLPKHIKLTFL